ncbi:MAG: hypothetical protein IJ297_02375 [Clostridia bacterium]|nr:hypothetical protein [Clostridia bacterium]
MKKVLSIITIISMLFAVNVNAAEVVWSEYKTGTEVDAYVHDIKAGDKVTIGVFNKDNELVRAKSIVSEGESTELKVNTQGGEYARTFVWEDGSLAPADVVNSLITADGIKEDAIFSDNQQPNRSNAVTGYRSFDAVSGEYMIKIYVTVWKKGDNAIVLGDSSNGTLHYGTSCATLLFNGDNFAVRDGAGDGNYAANAVNLCAVDVNKTYEVVFWGNTTTDTYKVIITQGKNRYTSGTIHSRTNGESIDTIALISNGKNTSVTNEGYSNFAFTGKNLTVITNPEDMMLEPIHIYDGFEGIYYGIMVDGKYVRGNNGKLTYDYDSVKDDSAKFLPRNMGDGSHAFVCRSSNNRMTAPSTVLQNIASSAYATNDDSQHWVMEKSENWAEDNLSYYLKHIETGNYIGKAIIGSNLTLRGESSKAEVTFVPLYEESPLYLVSKTQVYDNLTDRQRFMIESVYESVAGDIFGRYGGYTDWTPRIRMDNLFNEVLSGGLTESEQQTKFSEFFNDTNGFIYSGQANYETVSLELPGSVGCYTEVGDGEEGTYDFWRSTMLSGVKYPVTIYDADGNKEQTLTVYVHNNDVAEHNYSIFLQAIIQIPYQFRTHLKNVKIRNDSANSFNGGGNDVYVRLNWKMDRGGMRSTLVHELGHVIDQNNGNWASGSGWSWAIGQDLFTPSTYGANNNAEDFAEFCRMYFQAYSCRDRQRGLAIIMPERYASFGRLRKQNMSGWGLWEDGYTS